MNVPTRVFKLNGGELGMGEMSIISMPASEEHASADAIVVTDAAMDGGSIARFCRQSHRVTISVINKNYIVF